MLRALLIHAFFSVRSERQLMERLTYNMMFRWFVGLSMDAPVWDVTVFTKNRERLAICSVAGIILHFALVWFDAEARDYSTMRSLCHSERTRRGE